MKIFKSLLLIFVLFVLSATTHARVTTVSGGATTSYSFFDRSYVTEGGEEGAAASTDSDEDDYSRLIISPFITIVSESEKDAAEFRYSPSFRRELDDSESDIDHHFSLNYNRALSGRWDITLSDTFVPTDDYSSSAPVVDSETGEIISERPGADPVTGERLNDDRGRRSYFTNTFSAGTAYTYLEDSVFSADYSWTALRNDENEAESSSSDQDYDKHNFNVAVAHRINSRWKVSGGLGYIMGLYDSSVSDSATLAFDLETESADLESASADLDTELADLETELADLDPASPEFDSDKADLESQIGDLESASADLDAELTDLQTELADLETESDNVDEFNADLRVDYYFTRRHSFNTSYNYSLSDYESDLRADSEIHDITFGWAWEISPTLNVSLGAGPTYSKTDGQSGSWDNNGNVALNYRFEKGSLSVVGSGGQDFENFSGTNERNLTEYWQLQTNLSYSVLERATLTAYATYRNEDSEEAGAVTTGTADSDTTTTIAVNKETYGLGMGVNYILHQDWSANLSYGYTKQESDIADDEYDDHSVTVSISYQNDFFRW